MPLQNNTTYGTLCQAPKLEKLLRHLLDHTFKNEDASPPLCIWGSHGIGKTEIVQALAMQYDCPLIQIAPAQFEEMGDLIGMPRLVTNELAEVQTQLAPPNWIPQGEGPGILLIDDVNRADDRILRGIMQLLQSRRLISWQLPPHWQIVLTANPEGGNYSITPMDDAMLTRMLHATLVFDASAWAVWAQTAGIDERGIHFVLAYPELVNQKRTTPRTLVQCFRELEKVSDWQEQADLVQMLTAATLDREVSAAFISFLKTWQEPLLSAEHLLNAEQFDTVATQLRQLANEKVQRIDLLMLIFSRLAHLVHHSETTLSELQLHNLKAFLTLDFLPNDLQLGLAQDLSQSQRPEVVQLISQPEVARLLLSRM